MKYILLLTLTTYLFAQEDVHSSVFAYAENREYTNSLQKKDGIVYGVGADIHVGSAEYKMAYEQADVNTIQPPLDKNLQTSKIFLKFAYKFDKNFEVNVNYISILKDNIAETDSGYAGGGGITYNFDKKLSTNFTQYFSIYDKFDVFQSDLRIDYKTKFDKVKVKFSSVTKYIYIENGDESSPFTKNADKNYFTTAVEVHSHYKSYHLGAAAYFGKRAFAVMQDGFKIQHHAMEFDKTYAVGAGKTFGDFIFRVQYIYQRATELPLSNEGVEVSTLRFITNYKF